MKEVGIGFICLMLGMVIMVLISNIISKQSNKKLTDYLISTWPVSIVGKEDIIEGNMQDSINQWLEVSSNVRFANVTKTVDTNCYVISLKNLEGKEASLWLNSDGTLRTITPY